MTKTSNIHVHDHPLLKHKLGYLRDQRTYSHEFRELTKEISRILAYEVMKDWTDMEKVTIQTPIAKATIERIVNAPVVVSIMRAGNGMLDAVLSMIPFASAGFIGIYRDKFVHNTVEYYFKMPVDVKGRTAIICDPLISTADTIIAAIDRLKSYEVKKIKVLAILISEFAVEKIYNLHPDVELHTVGVETEINELGYLVPGLGDAGDRLYQTK
ncbi:MAG: uracil phosphoribosyltransferase [Moraxellaceae bacterium]|nr:uracil phosphoribosyltransferase [Pseudobdellovibrionaceae bacterium]